jgi:hypothetical protein
MTTYEQQRKQRLMTVLSAAVRIGRAGVRPDSVVAAELNDLAELYLAAAHVPYGVVGSGPAALPIHNPDFKGMEVQYSHGVDVPDALRSSILDEATKVLKEQLKPSVPADMLEHRPYVEDVIGTDIREREAALLKEQAAPSDLCMVYATADEVHDHVCDKVAGHADGPHGSDHQCAACGQLYTSPGDGAAEAEGEAIEL